MNRFLRQIARIASSSTISVFATITLIFLVELGTAHGQVIQGENRLGRAGNIINFSELAASDASLYSPVPNKTKPIGPRLPKKKLDVPKGALHHNAQNLRTSPSTSGLNKTSPTSALSLTASQAVASDSNSPPPSASFEGLISDTRARNPDTSGAVGPNHLMVALNSQVRIQNRQGVVISTVTLDSFWAGLRPIDPVVFDPRVIYDPYAQRFIFTAEANPTGTNSRTNDPGVLVAVSQTSDPTGNWYRYFIDVDTTNPVYADSPNVGFNKDWIVVQADTYLATNCLCGPFGTNTDAFFGSEIFVLNKTNLYAGGPLSFTQFSIGNGSYAHVPSLTYDTNLAAIYLMTDWVGSAYSSSYDTNVGWLRIYTINGPVTAPVLVDDQNFVTSDPTDDWSDYTSQVNFAPQLGTTNRIVNGDSRVQSLVYRNGSLWMAHVEFKPVDDPYIGYVNFWQIFPGGVRVQKVNLIDPTYSSTRAYPSIAVNSRNDVLVAYSRFANEYYAGAAYFFQAGDYTASGYPLEIGRYRNEVVLKAGEAPYYRPDTFGQNLWGDWSAACVDPLNDLDLWTLQEYAATPANGIDRWGTWWGRISPLVSLTLRMTATPVPALAGGNLTYNIVVTNNYAFMTNDLTGGGGVRIVDPLPANVIFVSATASQGACSLSNNAVVCDIGTLRDGTQATATVVVRPNASGFVTNIASVSAFGPDRDPTDNTVALTTQVNPAADITVAALAVPNPVTLGSNIAYSIVVTNQGPSPAASVNVTNTLPSSVSFVSVQSSIGACSRNGSVVTCNLGTLNPGNFASISITGTVTTAGLITNSVIALSTFADPNLANNLTLVTARVNAKPTISAIGPQNTLEDTTFGPISFTVADAENASSSLILSGSSANPSLFGAGSFSFGGSGSSRTVTITPLPNQFGTTTVSIAVTDLDNATSFSSFTVGVAPVNDPPTLDLPGPVTILEDSGVQNIPLTGISAGPNESQTLIVTASSANTNLVPNPLITYSSPNSTGTLTFTPVTNAVGSTTITVTVNDGGGSNNIVQRTFSVTVNPVNDPPTLDPLNPVNIAEDAPTQVVTMLGITAGAPNESQTLSISATSSDTTIIPNPAVSYTSPNSFGSLSFAPVANAFGTATITVTVDDHAGSNNIVTRTFTVNVNPVNDAPTLNTIGSLSMLEDTVETVNLTGISSGAANESQTLTITARSSDTAVLPDPTVTYTSPNTTGMLTLRPATNVAGSVTVTVTINDGGASNNIVTRSFPVIVNAVNDPPTIDVITNVVVAEDSGARTVNFTGISSGAPNENQSLQVTASSSDTTIIPNPSVSYTSPNASGSLSFTPVANASGTATISVTVNDGGASNNVTTQTFTVTVNPINDPPTLAALTNVVIAEDSGAQTIPLSGIGSGAANEDQLLTLTATSSDTTIIPNPTVTYTSPNSTGSLSFTPVTNAFGAATITVQVDDGGGSNNIVQRTFTVTVNAVNDPPTVGPISDVIVDEDSGAQIVNLSGITAGAPNEAQTLTVTATSSNPQIIPNPTVTYTSPNSTGSLRFVPVTNAAGNVTITVTINDGGASNNAASRTFDVTVNPINDLPTISSIADNVTLEDVPITLPFVINDVETPASALQLIGESSNDEVIHGSDISFDGVGTNRNVTIRPLTNQFGSATITITVRDGDGGTASTSFELEVDPVNDAPIISVASVQTIDEDTSTGPVAFTISDPESPSDDLTVPVVSFSRPDLVPSGNIVLAGSGDNWTVSLTPLPNLFGTGTVSIVVFDPDGAGATNSFELRIRSVNDLPSISGFSAQTINEDSVLPPVPVTITDLETPAANLTLTGSSSNPTIVPDANITFSGTGSNRFVSLRPATNQNGNVIITIFVHDSDGGVSSGSFPLTIRSVNDVPVIGRIADQITDEDVPKAVNFTVSDIESAAGSLHVTGSSANPAVVPSANLVFGGSGANRTLTITPLPDQFGSTTITVTVDDGQGGASTATFHLTVNPVNDPPTLAAIADVVIDEDSGPHTVNLSGITSGAANENQLLTLSVSSSDPNIISNFALSYGSPNTTGTLTFSPMTNANGTANITVSVNDGATTNNVFSRTFKVTVNPINDPPSIAPVPDQGTDKGVPLGPVNVFVADVDGVTNLTVTGTSSNTGLVANAGIVVTGTGGTRSMTVTPLPNQIGSTIITLTVRDPSSATASTSFRLTVNQANELPTISSIANQTILEDTSTAALSFVVGDAETPVTSLVITARSSNSQLLSDTGIALTGTTSNRTLRLTPNTNQSGNATITLTVRDTDGMSASTSFLLTVMATNDPPILGPIANQTINEDSILSLPLSLNDLDSDPASLVLSGSSTNTALVPNANIAFAGSGLARTLQITPATNASGTTAITVTLSDGTATTTQTFVLTVTAINDPPTLNALSNLVVSESAGAQSVNLNGISSGAANEVQTLTVFATSSNPGLIPTPSVTYTSPNATGTLNFTPVAGSNGAAVITVTVNDGQAQNGSTSRSFAVTVTPVNDRPTIAAIANQPTPEDTPLTIPITINDIDTGAFPLTITATSSVPSLVAVSNIVISGAGSSRSMTITPSLNQTGTTTITLIVSDGITNASTAFVLTVNPVNDPPTLNPLPDLTLLISPGNQTVTLSGISTGATNEVQTLTVTATSSNTALFANPTVTYSSPNATGTIGFRPANNAVGRSLITVTVSDGAASNSTTSQSFLVNIRDPAVNANPTISALSNVTINEDAVAGPISFTVADSGTSATLLTLAGRSSNTLLVPTNNIVFGGSGGSRTVTVTPAPNRSGVATITVSVTDTNFGSVSTNFVLTVNPVNDAPTILPISSQTILEDTVSPVIPITIGDIDTPAANLTVTATSGNQTLVPNANIVVGGSGTNRGIVITPATNQFGTSTITVTVSDGVSNSVASFVLTVNPVNDLPTIAAIPDQTTAEDTPTAAIPITIGDVETAAGSLQLIAGSSVPSLVSSFAFGGSGANRTLVIAPATNQSGTATITITLADTDGGVTNTTFLLTVTPVNDPPTLDPISNIFVNQDSGAQIVNLTGITSGASEGQALAVTASSSNPDVLPNPGVSYTSPGATGSLSFTPAPGTNGSAVITVTVNDGQSQNNTVARTFTVTVNDKPSISVIPDQVSARDVIIGPLAFTVGDRDTAASNLTVTATSSNQGLIPNSNILLGGGGSNQTIRLTPATGQIGSATITITATDANNLSSTRTFDVTVRIANTAPTVNPIADLIINEDAGPQTVNLSGIGSGDASETQVLGIVAVSSNPSLIPHPTVTYSSPNATGALAFTPIPNANGSAIITVTVGDGGTLNSTTSRSFTVTVNPANDPPTISAIPDYMISENSSTAIALTVSDIDTPASGLMVTGQSSDQMLIPDSAIKVIGSGNNRTLLVTPALDEVGAATITLTVSDGSLSANTSFNLSVLRIEDSSPLLRIRRAGPNVVLSWSTNFPGLFLHSKPLMAGSSWDVETNTPVAVMGRYFVTNTASGLTRFYQLGAPRLTIVGSGPDVIISWPAAISGFHLETSPLADPAVTWTAVGIVPNVNGSTQSITLPRSDAVRFFRLTSP